MDTLKGIAFFIIIICLMLFAFSKLPHYSTNDNYKPVKQSISQDEKGIEHDFNQDAINIQTMFSGL